jgi:hypothetical protein
MFIDNDSARLSYIVLKETSGPDGFVAVESPKSSVQTRDAYLGTWLSARDWVRDRFSSVNSWHKT